MVFRPTLWIKNVLSIDKEYLCEHNIEGLILDLDNTLSMHGNPVEEVGIMDWLTEMKRLRVRMIIVSNNTEKRVSPLAKKLGLPFISFGCKPLTFGINSAVKKINLPKSKICLVGDQIFTDVMGGNIAGIRTILVEPFEVEKNILFVIKRKAENLFFKRDYDKLEKK